MKNGAIKVAITLSRSLLKSLKDMSRRRHKSLDILVRELLDSHFAYSGRKEEIRRYIKGYKCKPETSGEVKLAEKLSLPLLAEEGW